MHFSDDVRALADRRPHALHRTVAHVAHGKDALHVGLVRRRRAVGTGRLDIGAGADETGPIDVDAARRVWDAALATEITGPAVWFHGDIAPGNLLLRSGRLAAVIDFGTSGMGDPACDLAIAWTMFDDPARAAFRRALPWDDDVWVRGRAWALWKAMLVAGGDTGSHDPEAEARSARAVIERILADAP